ncbi:DUF3426 domain-containing protein [Variovorax sp. J22G21]|uniref:zinc-ribbon and DUF3426 domain-containing protein n=1 Tax=Variovorax fucosicus TaxID=3053517 RepID=UPI00257530A1|nr:MULTISPECIES: DUF3426 domain-containing protein [unclassified Variovorax]MDM0038370.1 DUF3426 domain-containing protein [Variovorax sp. J22R193]MDM0063146.1 DUF3426 domain-containing protein [Variovorax sp. J22G21]
MSLVTRCPSCATTFKVVRDQLRISDGWVRCGRCSNVFDATLDLQEAPEAGTAAPAAAPEEDGAASSSTEADPPSSPEPEPPALPEPEAQSSTPLKAAFPPPAWPGIGVVADEPWPTPSVPAPAEPMPVLARSSLVSSVEALDDFSAVVEQAADAQLQKALRRARIDAVRSARARKAAQPPTEPLPREETSSPPMPVVSAASVSEARVEELPPSEPLFAEPTAVEHSHGTKAGRATVIAAVVCALLLVLQVLRHERDTIVARQPSWRPVLEAICGATGCELSALRQIGAITIDGAAFAREKSGDGYRLNFTLRNAVAMPLAMPAVELSLLDTQERPVVRRVLMPSDFGAPPVLAAKAERTASLPLALTGLDSAALQPVAGYRVVAFYP